MLAFERDNTTFSLQEIAELLGLHYQAARMLLFRNEMAGFKVHGKWRIRYQAYIDFLDGLRDQEVNHWLMVRGNRLKEQRDLSSKLTVRVARITAANRRLRAILEADKMGIAGSQRNLRAIYNNKVRVGRGLEPLPIPKRKPRAYKKKKRKDPTDD